MYRSRTESISRFSFWQQLDIEFRWFRFSKVGLFVLLAIVAFTLWNLYSIISYNEAMNEVFRQSAADYSQAGGDVGLALKEEAGVTEISEGTREIRNTVRYDYDNLLASLANFTLLGSANHLLGTASVLVLPAGCFFLGLLFAQHETRSGAIALRLGGTSRLSMISGKAGAIIVISMGTIATGLITCWTSIAIYRLFNNLSLSETSSVPLSSLPSTLFLAGSVAIVFALFGLACGSFFANPGWFLSIFLMLYFLIPILGAWDPRNVLASAAWKLSKVHGFFIALPAPELTGVQTGIFALLFLLFNLSICSLCWKFKEFH